MFKGLKNAIRGGIGTVAEKSQDIASNVVNDRDFSTTAIKDKLEECHLLQAELVDCNNKEKRLLNRLREAELQNRNAVAMNSRLNTLLMKKDRKICALTQENECNRCSVRGATHTVGTMKKEIAATENDLKIQDRKYIEEELV